MKSRYAEALTHREQEVIELLSAGRTNEEIARQLGISLAGVKYHVSGIFRRLRVKNRHEAASLHLGTEGGVLTPREQEVIELLSTGLTNEEIARQLGISLDGVKYHVSEILRRLDVESRREAASLHLRTERSGRLATWAPVMFLRKLPFAWPAKAAAGAVLAATAVGIVVLAWGVLSTSTDTLTTPGCSGEQSAGSAPNCAPGVTQAATGAGPITAISAGMFHSCALRGGGVWCWGGYFDSDGVSPDTGPLAVPGLTSGVSAISSGIDSCALQHGGVWCWGAYPDRNGNLTVGVPVEIAGLTSGVSAISSGGGTTCALKDGGVWCWKQILYGGASTGVRFSAPSKVPGLESGVTAISAAQDHNCALKDGGVWCWGQSQIVAGGQSTGVRTSPPVSVPGLASGVTAVSAGDVYSCALKDDGVWCWSSVTPEPVAVPGLTSGVSAISGSCALKGDAVVCWVGGGDMPLDVPRVVPGLAGGVTAINGTCALKDGGVWCWGDNGQHSYGTAAPPLNVAPVAVSGLTSAVSAISAGENHICALKGGGVWCWGRNHDGQLGNNDTTDSPVPVAVPGLAGGVSAISARADYSCALKDDGAWCWGWNSDGLLGNNTPLGSHVPVAVPQMPGEVSAIGPQDGRCELKEGGVSCWRSSEDDALVRWPVPGLESGVVAISARRPQDCALKDGGVWCWAYQSDPTDPRVPVQVRGLEGGVSALSGPCALKDGGVWCWGDNSYGELGNNSAPDSPFPVAVQFPP